jgi:hypothetical protein
MSDDRDPGRTTDEQPAEDERERRAHEQDLEDYKREIESDPSVNPPPVWDRIRGS